ncbi:glutamate receptor 2.7 isoform X1 [Morus notabilis]|uniref:glutamate receptor 2.7 isoform X1 n=1 Tax=Morus notabilis TaxID=981085 RepID=UPI000CED37B7|nr:glutamate receptor 2.7 isoform X1 [Morus notabilis]
MSFDFINSVASTSKLGSLMCHVLLIAFFLINITSHGTQATNKKATTNVGIIIDFDSRIGKEQRAAMEIAAQNFNNSSKGHKLSLYFHHSKSEPLMAASSAKKMIEEKNAEVIIGMETWQEAALVGKVGNQTQVPIISLVSPSITPPQMQLRWPFLVTMANDALAEIKCIADLVCAYKWRKVVVIYEDDDYGDGSGALTILNEAFQNISSEIEYCLVLPPYSSLSDPKGVVLDNLLKLLSVQSRVFVVLQSSSPMVAHLFREAKKIGLLQRDSAWIITKSVTSLLDSLDHSIISSMKGTLGIKTYYDKRTSSYKAFNAQFQYFFGEANPGIHALRAYDSIGTITQALERMTSNASAKMLLENILSANFSGLSGKVSFKEGKLVHNPILRIVNVVDKGSYHKLDYWNLEYGFFNVIEKAKIETRGSFDCKNSTGLSGSVLWPGNSRNSKPKGWAMPTISKPLKIGVPGKTQFRKFVTVDESKKYSNDQGYDGLCVRIFRKVLQRLDYDIPYRFEAFYGTYDELVDAVYNKTFDAVVGDVTILADRLDCVEFTQPYMESGLSMVVPIRSKESTWIFIKPFTGEMWVVTGAIFAYTMLIVWFLEHPTNPEFSGTLKNQVGTTLWFTFSSIFFAQREKIHSNITRVVVMMWLFLVFIVTASYTASLSSRFTVRQLEPETDIAWLKRTNQKVGCDGDSFVRRYLEHVLEFKAENIHNVTKEYDYAAQFTNKNIIAAFLELPYERVFLNKYCKEFTTTTPTYRFGGLGFVFQKGSPIAKDVSEAILKLSEDGNITSLVNQCLIPSDECSSEDKTTNESQSLSLKSFWGIYLISGATSTICFLVSLVRLQYNYRRHRQTNVGNQSMKNMVFRLARHFHNGEASYSPGKVTSTSIDVSAPDLPSIDEWSSSRRDSVSTLDAPNHLNSSFPVKIETPLQTRDGM